MGELVKLQNSTLLVIFSVMIVLPFCNFNSFINYISLQGVSFQTVSSVWCVKNSNNTNLCKFKNVCYDSHIRALLFFLSEESVIKGLNHYTEMQKIQLSSVDSHNQFFANISIIDIQDYKIEKKIHIAKKVFLISRFKPDNAMHVIHDDIFPLFLTLEYFCSGNIYCMESYSLVIHDTYPNGPYFDLYKLLSNQNPIILNKEASNADYLICFEEMLAGLVTDSIFYQYGFNKPHGPVYNPFLTNNDILRFTSFVKDKLRGNKGVTADIVIINRKKNRKILNINEVINIVKHVCEDVWHKKNINVVVLDLLSSNISHFINTLSQCNILVGMHGAEMIFSLFNKPNSAVIELFPFGIQPEIVSFIKPISELENSHITYFAWKNDYKNNSIAHPNAHPLFGGINHLDKMTQEQIKNTQVVPGVECCNNSTYLYHMYQDTWVANEFKNFFQFAVSKLASYQNNSKSKFTIKKWFYPHIPVNISCKFDVTKRLLFITWQPPSNIKTTNNLEYSIYISDKKNKFRKSFLTKLLYLFANVPEETEICPIFFLWISVRNEINNLKSKDTHMKCFCS